MIDLAPQSSTGKMTMREAPAGRAIRDAVGNSHPLVLKHLLQMRRPTPVAGVCAVGEDTTASALLSKRLDKLRVTSAPELTSRSQGTDDRSCGAMSGPRARVARPRRSELAEQATGGGTTVTSGSLSLQRARHGMLSPSRGSAPRAVAEHELVQLGKMARGEATVCTWAGAGRPQRARTVRCGRWRKQKCHKSSFGPVSKLNAARALSSSAGAKAQPRDTRRALDARRQQRKRLGRRHHTGTSA